MILQALSCPLAGQCRNNICVRRAVQILGLKPNDSQSEWAFEKKYGKPIVPRWSSVPMEYPEVGVNCEDFVG